MSDPEQLSVFDRADVANLSQTDVQFVRADLVRMVNTDAEVITADEIELEKSAVGNLKANQVTASKSALASVSTTELSAEKTVTGYVRAEKATVSGYIGAVVSGSAEIHQGVTGLVAGTNVRAEGARSLLLIGHHVTGNVITLMDSRSALLAGLTGGLFAGLVLWLGRMLFGRK